MMGVLFCFPFILIALGADERNMREEIKRQDWKAACVANGGYIIENYRQGDASCTYNRIGVGE